MPAAGMASTYWLSQAVPTSTAPDCTAFGTSVVLYNFAEWNISICSRPPLSLSASSLKTFNVSVVRLFSAIETVIRISVASKAPSGTAMQENRSNNVDMNAEMPGSHIFEYSTTACNKGPDA